MICNYTRSESGNITVVSIGSNLLISIEGGFIYLVTNPDNPGFFENQIGQVDATWGDTPNQIIERIKEQHK